MAAILISVNDIIMKLILAIIEESIYVPMIGGASIDYTNDAFSTSAYPIAHLIALQHLRQYPWPGNVRELQNVIERAVILSQGEVLEIEPLLSSRSLSHAPSQLKTLEAVEREHILRTLEETTWVISGLKGAAAILGMNANTLRSRMLKLGISRK